MHKLPFLIILLIGISLTPLSFAEGIPEWVKNNASWWSERLISQNEFTSGLEFLINEGIIYIPPTEPGIPGPEKSIPDWVRNTAGWWSDGKIPDSEFTNAMKYLIEIGIIEIDASSPEIIKEEIIEELPETQIIIGKPLNLLLEGYKHVHTDGRFVLDVLVFDAEKYTGTKFNRNAAYTIDGVNIKIELYNEEGLIHIYDGVTQNGFLRYDVMAKETMQSGTLWMINNLYTANIVASLDGQTVEKTYEFYGQASAYAYNAGSSVKAPVDLTATAGDDKVTLAWTSPAGVKGITDYRIEFSTGFNGPWTTFSHTASAAVTDVVDGLDDSTKYYFRVAAENYSGTGKYSAVASATTT
tara:strand:+ start:289 stop:1353 length:1065 start_codon:yes stop_codon:yes gene_type:complete